jgi:hypothetical protein
MVRALFAAALLLVTSSAARADDPGERSWYGWQLLLADVAAGMVPIAVNNFGHAGGEVNREGFITGVALWALLSPAIHLAHGREGAAAKSLVLRLALPLAIGGVAYAIGNANCPQTGFQIVPCGIGPGAVGAAVGFLGATLIDASALGWSEAPPRVFLTADPKHGALGLGGRF